MRAEGLDVEAAEMGGTVDHLSLACDVVALAASVHRGRHQPELVEFEGRHRHLPKSARPRSSR